MRKPLMAAKGGTETHPKSYQNSDDTVVQVHPNGFLPEGMLDRPVELQLADTNMCARLDRDGVTISLWNRERYPDEHRDLVVGSRDRSLWIIRPASRRAPWYHIVNYATGEVLHNDGGSEVNGTACTCADPLLPFDSLKVRFEAASASNRHLYIKFKKGAYCHAFGRGGVNANNLTNGAPVTQWEYYDQDNFEWQFVVPPWGPSEWLLHYATNSRASHIPRQFVSTSHQGHGVVITSLLKAQATVDARDAYGNPVLTVAASLGHREIAVCLLKLRASVNELGSRGNTALIAAAQNGQISVVDMLLAHSADPRIQDKLGTTALSYAAMRGHVELGRHLYEARHYRENSWLESTDYIPNEHHLMQISRTWSRINTQNL